MAKTIVEKLNSQEYGRKAVLNSPESEDRLEGLGGYERQDGEHPGKAARGDGGPLTAGFKTAEMYRRR